MLKVHHFVPVFLMVACAPEQPGDDDAVAARDAVLETNRALDADRATAEGIDVSTGFVAGDETGAVDTIAGFWESQEACSDVTVDGNTITVDFGSLDDDCEFGGRTYAGLDVIRVLAVDPLGLVVHHDWSQFTNGTVTVDGTVDLGWIGDQQDRHVSADFVLANFVDATIVEVQADHVLRRLDPELPVREGGFVLDGSREWTSGARDWSLDMTGLEVRPADPAPQAGVVSLTNPAGDTLTIAYERIDADTIAATVVGPDGLRRLFHIDAEGDVTAAGSE